MFFVTIMRYRTRLKTFVGIATGVIVRAWKTMAGFARRLVIYCCLAAAIILDRILDCLERFEETK